MSQELNSIIDQLANIDSASAKIMQKTQDEKAKYADYISKEKQAFDQNLEDQVNAQVNEYEKTLAKESEKEIAKYQEDCNAELAKLESAYNEKTESLAQEIFNNIIKEWYDYHNKSYEETTAFFPTIRRNYRTKNCV